MSRARLPVYAPPEPETVDPYRLQTIESLAEALSVSARTIRRWIDSGTDHLEVHRLGPTGRTVRVALRKKHD